jgi:UDP-N-acetyl-D-mannosaminuronic acid dehydrogenase
MMLSYSKKGVPEMFNFDICVIGGCGRVGLPLSIAFADKGLNVVIYDLDKDRMDEISQGVMPFLEEGCPEKLKKVINKNLRTTDNPDLISQSKFIITTTGTPVEEHLNPQYTSMTKFFNDLLPFLVKGQYIILRSTVYPGTADRINRLLKESGANVHLAFCPERIVEGKALEELASLPQIVSAFDEQVVQEVSNLFQKLTKDVVVLEPIEAELAKLFTNAWRYIEFSTANQFFMLADQYHLDFYKIYHGMTYKYPRTQGLPKAGFAAGPCLLKDTMQLAAFSNNSFFLGHSAMLVNEGLPNYIVQKLKEKTDLRDKSVGILGMAFKANSDDERDSLSFKLKAILQIEAKAVYCTDPYVKRDYFISIEELVNICDIIIVAAPHNEYKTLDIGKDKILVDIWNFFNKGGII